MASASKLEALLEVIRSAKTAAEYAQAEKNFLEALLDSTVYAHRPSGPMPSGRLRFVQFQRPDNGQTVLPFFTDVAQAEVPLSPERALISMTGRELFELTRGATLMMNPNRERAALYPAEIEAILAGRPLGHLTHETVRQEEQVGVCLPSVPTDALVSALRALFTHEPAVRAGYLIEIHRGADGSDVFLLLTLVVTKGNEERLTQLTSLALGSISPPLQLPVTMTCMTPDEPLPELCHHGIQFYGT